MANPEHLEILKQGVEVWNKWRKEHLVIRVPDLRDANLISAKLFSADLRGANLSGSHLRDAYLGGANLSGADLRDAILIRAHLSTATLASANLTGADLSGANLSGADLSGSHLFSADLENADLNGSKLENAILNGADLRDANLRDANLSYTHLTGADLTGANLNGANLNGASFKGADLRDVNLSYADLSGATLSDATLNGANLSGATLNRSTVNGADFTISRMGTTTLADIDLSEAKGLETIRHISPSTIGIDTLYKSAGKIPEAFLRGCGVPEPFIIQIPALVAALEPIQFYSCFISYSSKDQDFAERLYADLQNKGVRCWFAPEDLKIGDKIRDRIDESIRLRDKLLLILSENSIASDWVEHEVESALEEEGRTGRTILFPIRLDDAVMESNKAWAALIRRTRHVGDFTRWKDQDSYQKAFDRLLRDLKAEDQQTAEG
ncbi:MAG: hypothetical protein QOG71_3889 [Pyrinomonadaceae bacterium]|nr:hypothetical protein [Pyrinomonadaceae bacterium]